jgi:hypothetical protein
MPGTYVYIDALNLYYGALKGTPDKWLDVEAFVRRLLPHDQIIQIRYFTANVKPLYQGDRVHERQAAYLRALKSNPLIDVVSGHFRSDLRWRPLAEQEEHARDLFRPHLRPLRLVQLLLNDAARRRTESRTSARVIIREEKGSDVSLGVTLVYDALTGASARAVVISNDADLQLAIKLVVGHGVPVSIVNPHRGPTNGRLLREASSEIPLRRSIFGQCQLPPTVQTSNGKQVHKPRQW